MKRYFCDVCGSEIGDENAQCAGSTGNRVAAEVIGKHGKLSVEVHAAINDTWNAGDVCKYCIIDAVNRADDRPSGLAAN